MSSFSTLSHRTPQSRSAGMMSHVSVLGVGLLAYGLIGFFSVGVHAGQARTVTDGVYSDAQAARGQAVFKERCSICHGAALEGSAGPPLVGADFIADFNKQPLSDLFSKIYKTMPQDEPGTLTEQQAAELVAHILQMNKYPAGRADLGATEAVLRQIAWPAATTFATTPTTTGGAAQAPTWALTGNLLQVMRAIFFPNSNVIFNTQTHDPGEKKEPTDSVTAGINWVEWGSMLYAGWESVDNAAVALAEATPLLLVPGRRCQNGKPVPVERADWVKYTMDMLQAAQKAYKASQTRNQETVSDSTNDLSDACLACHRVYRDKRAPGSTSPADPANLALRCTP